MPVPRRLLAVVAGIAVCLGVPTAALATDNKQVEIAGEHCDSGIATSANLSLSNVTIHDIPGIQVWVNTEGSALDAELISIDDNTATYIVHSLDGPLKNARASVPPYWDGDFEVEIICESAKEPTVIAACDFDGVDPKVLNVKVNNHNPVGVRYTITVVETKGATSGRNLSRFAEKRLDVPGHSSDEADFGPIHDGSTFQVTVTGRDGSKTVEHITCGVMPGSITKHPKKKPSPTINPAAGPTATPTAAVELPLEPTSKADAASQIKKKPVAGMSGIERIALAFGVSMILLVVAGILAVYIVHRRRKQEDPETT